MKQLIKDNWIELVLILLAFIGLFVHALPAIPFATLCLLIMFFRLDIVGIIAICLYAAPKLTGSICLAYNIAGVGGAIIILTPILIIYYCFMTKKLKFINIKGALPSFVLFFLYLLFSVLLFGNEWSWTKLSNTFVAGIVGLLTYITIFSNHEKCNFIRTGLYFFLIAFLLLLLSPIFNHGSGPQDILDFGYLRKQNGEWGDLEVSGIIAYQQVGFVAVLGFGTLMLEELKGSINTLFLLLALLMCIIASFYAGARQFIVISILLVVLWTLFEKRGSASKVLVPIFSVILVYFLYNILFSSEGMLYSVQTDGYLRASDRDGLVEQGLNDFHKSPFVGIGYGCFDFFGTIGGYPHNLFVEILAELGILGLLLFWIPLCKPLFTILFKIRPCLYLMIIYFFRSMASGGLDTNIYLYSFILASYCVFASQPLEKQNNNN